MWWHAWEGRKLVELVLGTTNEHKVVELRRLLAELPLRILTPADFPEWPHIEETGETFEENAVLKAYKAAEHTGRLTLADDSGLEVDALNGAPGVRSARYAGERATDEDNNRKLLEALAGVPSERRTARYVCVIAIAEPPQAGLGPRLHVGYGGCEGRIALEPRGDQGFGYDPLFIVPQYDRTFGELPPDVKDQIGHRGRALRWAKEELRQILRQAGAL